MLSLPMDFFVSLKQLIDTGLVTGTLRLEPLKNISIDAQRHLPLGRHWSNGNRFRIDLNKPKVKYHG